MSIVDRMPKFGDWILFNGVSFLFWEVRQDELQLTVKRLAVEALCRREAEAAAEAD